LTKKKKVVKKRPKKAVRKTAKKPAVLPSRAFAVAAAKIARDSHCTDIVILNLTGLCPSADYFIVATSTSDRQGRSVANEISQLAPKFDLQRFGLAGYQQGRWILLDFIDVIVHIFDPQFRDYYNLEMLWGDAEKIDY